MLVGAMYEGCVPDDPVLIKNVCHIDWRVDLKSLIKCGFLEKVLADASTVQANAPSKTETETETEERQRERGKRAQKCALPGDWQPTDALVSYGLERGLTTQQVKDAAETMKSWASENSENPKGRKKNWTQAFEGWLRRDAERLSKGNGHGPGRPRALQDDSLSASRAAARLAEKAERGEFAFGPRPGSVLPAPSRTDVVVLSKRRDA